MAVNIMNQSSRVRLQFINGLDSEGNEKLVSKSYNNVRPSAADQDIYDVSVSIGGLQDKGLKTILRVDEKEIVE